MDDPPNKNDFPEFQNEEIKTELIGELPKKPGYPPGPRGSCRRVLEMQKQIREWRSQPNCMTFKEIGKLLGITRDYAKNLNKKELIPAKAKLVPIKIKPQEKVPAKIPQAIGNVIRDELVRIIQDPQLIQHGTSAKGLQINNLIVVVGDGPANEVITREDDGKTIITIYRNQNIKTIQDGEITFGDTKELPERTERGG